MASSRPDRGLLLIRFEGIDERDSAEDLAGAVLEIATGEVPEAPEGFYYHFQLVGCRVFDLAGGEARELGEVSEVLEDGGGHVLRIDRENETLLVPFVDAFLRKVETETRRIDVELPEGLIESCTSRR